MIPQLVVLTIQSLPDEKSLGFQVRQGTDDIPEVTKINPYWPASRVPLKVGYKILTIEGRRVRNVEKCAELLTYFRAKQSSIEILVSVGPLLSGQTRVLVKADGEKPLQTILDDGSLQGLFLDEEGGDTVRVRDIGPTGIFARAKINKRDIILAIDNNEVHSIADCEEALKGVLRENLVLTTYNAFKKLRSTLVMAKASNHREAYEMGIELGSGAFGKVFMCRAKSTGETYAMKIVNRLMLTKELEIALKREVSILNELDHPNIMSLDSFFSTMTDHYLVTELLEGGELFDRIMEKELYTEGEAREVSRIAFEAIRHCHEKHVCHRDLKPENILLTCKDDDCQIKIADFGLARKAPEEDSLQTYCGSHYYISPEILKGRRYGTKTDIWSLGVVVFILLSGYPPFADEDDEVQKKLIKKGSYRFHDDHWCTVSNEAKYLITVLLDTNPKDRLSASEVLKHPWFKVDRMALNRNSLEKSRSTIAINFSHDTGIPGDKMKAELDHCILDKGDNDQLLNYLFHEHRENDDIKRASVFY